MKRPTQRSQTGATLIEVLIAVVVLSIGLLGLAGLQTTSIQSNYSAFYRSQATILAADITDRMRANRVAARNGDYNVTTAASAYTSTTTRADKDLNDWFKLVAKLPTGKASIARDTSTGIFTITILWDDTRGGIKKSDGTVVTADSSSSFAYKTEI